MGGVHVGEMAMLVLYLIWFSYIARFSQWGVILLNQMISTQGDQRGMSPADCWIWWMGAQRVQIKVVLPCLVHWALRAGTRDFYPALAALIGPVQNIFASAYTFSIYVPPSPSNLGRQPCMAAYLCLCVSVSTCLRGAWGGGGGVGIEVSTVWLDHTTPIFIPNSNMSNSLRTFAQLASF